MKTNLAVKAPRNFEGAPALPASSPIDQLRRTVMACMLWEDGFYEDGATIADRIKTLVAQCDPTAVAALAIEARTKMNLRHAPLLLVRELARHKDKPKIASTLATVIQRADELAEFVSIYWNDKKQPLSAQVKLGLALAFSKFDAYQLGKYNRDGAVKLRDVLFLSHAKPKDEAQAAVWKQLVDGTLPAPDTWEVALSAGADKGETFTRLIQEGKLGYLALLRNLRNMQAANVSRDVVAGALVSGAGKAKVLPFRYVAAARAVPMWEDMIDNAMLGAMQDMSKLSGTTVVLVDVSPSMGCALSVKSDLTRTDAACALAVLARGICNDVRVFAFSDVTGEAPARNGMALFDAIKGAVPSSGTKLGRAVQYVASAVPNATRLIVITDEESQDPVGAPHCKGYMINVASGKNGVGYGDWTRITGFSESVIGYIQEAERSSMV